MTGDDQERRWRVVAVVRQGVIAWMLGHLFVSALLLYAIYKPDPAGVKAWAYFLIALTPICLLGIYLEARAAWNGKDETSAAVATLVIAGAVGALVWYLG